MVIRDGVYPVILDRSPFLMIEEGKYRSVDRDIRQDKFSITGMRFWNQCQLVLVQLNRRARTSEVRKCLDELGLETGGIEHLAAFGSEYPDKERRLLIVELGSIWTNPRGTSHAVGLIESKGGRRLHLYCCSLQSVWEAGCCFLAIAK